MNWLLDGYELLLAEGFNQPQSVVDATKSYQHDSDKIQLFAEECLEEDARYEAKTASVYQSYRNWCNTNGCFPENSRNFNQALRTIGDIVRKRPNGGGEKTTLLTGFRLIETEFLC